MLRGGLGEGRPGTGPGKKLPRGGSVSFSPGDLGAQLQGLEDVGNGDKELEELGENLQSLEGVADGARNLEHGGSCRASRMSATETRNLGN